LDSSICRSSISLFFNFKVFDIDSLASFNSLFCCFKLEFKFNIFLREFSLEKAPFVKKGIRNSNCYAFRYKLT
jgi:hypothetical protein